MINDLDLKFIRKIVIINNFIKKKDIPELKINKKIAIFKFTKNLEAFYKRSFFTIGACGISLYEKSFFSVPSLSVSVAKNQNFNFKNFLSSKCILDLHKILNLNFKNKSNKTIFLKSIKKVESRLGKIFRHKQNKKNIKNFFKNI